MFEDTQEQWKDIDGFKGLYSVSNKGRVKNLKTGKVLAESDNGHGYKQVCLKGKTHKVHRLVALAFLDNPNKLPQVDHVDECKENNDVSNLRWVSKSDNIRHSIHKCSCKIKQIDKGGNLIKIWDSITQISRELGYNRGNIIKVCKKKLRSAYNFRWEYLDPNSQLIYNRPVIVHRGDEYIGEFTNAVKAAEALGLSYMSVYHCLQGCLKSNKGYTFEYK